jgi:hypothetical protein
MVSRCLSTKLAITLLHEVGKVFVASVLGIEPHLFKIFVGDGVPTTFVKRQGLSEHPERFGLRVSVRGYSRLLVPGSDRPVILVDELHVGYFDLSTGSSPVIPSIF